MGCIGKTVEEINGDYTGLEARVTIVEGEVQANIFSPGMIIPWNKRTAPTGWIMATESYDIGDTGSGADYEGSSYKDLWDEIWDNATDTGDDAYTLSAAKGADADADWSAGKKITIDLSKGYIKPDKCDVRAVGNYQEDAFQGHKHVVSTGSGTPGAQYSLTGPTLITTSNTIVGTPITDGTNGTPRTASETRPKNISFPMIIKL